MVSEQPPKNNRHASLLPQATSLMFLCCFIRPGSVPFTKTSFYFGISPDLNPTDDGKSCFIHKNLKHHFPFLYASNRDCAPKQQQMTRSAEESGRLVPAGCYRALKDLKS
jgi:hypothetical protein